MGNKVVIKPQSEFPLLQEYKKLFNISEYTIFAYDQVIYSNYPVSKDLIIHEKTHHKQQDRYGLKEWVNKYLTNNNFRLEMEIEAYKNQLQSVKDRNIRYKLKIECAKDLSSDTYGNIITFDKAMVML